MSTSIPDPREGEIARFRQLLRALSRGEIQRNTFETWEMDVLLDIMSCRALHGGDAKSILSRYESAAVRQLRKKGGEPLRLSLYLARVKRRQLLADRKP